jgi:hypothetical protein
MDDKNLGSDVIDGRIRTYVSACIRQEGFLGMARWVLIIALQRRLFFETHSVRLRRECFVAE